MTGDGGKELVSELVGAHGSESSLSLKGNGLLSAIDTSMIFFPWCAVEK